MEDNHFYCVNCHRYHVAVDYYDGMRIQCPCGYVYELDRRNANGTSNAVYDEGVKA